MKRLSTSLAFLTLLFAAAASVKAQTQPKPAPELKKLDYFLGKWTTDGDMKAGAMGSGGKVTSTGHAEWMEGGFFLVIHEDFKSAMAVVPALPSWVTTPMKRSIPTTNSTV